MNKNTKSGITLFVIITLALFAGQLIAQYVMPLFTTVPAV